MTNSSEKSELIGELTDKLLEGDIKLASTSLQNKHLIARDVVKSHVLVGMSLGMIPAPLVDLVAITGTQLNMVRLLCKHYDVDFDEKKTKVLLTSLVSSSLPVIAVVGLSSFAKIIPGVGTLGGSFSMLALSGALIYATGQVLIRHFDMGGTLDDFESKHWKDYFQQMFDEGKSFVKQQLKKQKMQKLTQEKRTEC
jgi:uncharacterized protein (DUF697 family)